LTSVSFTLLLGLDMSPGGLDADNVDSNDYQDISGIPPWWEPSQIKSRPNISSWGSVSSDSTYVISHPPTRARKVSQKLESMEEGPGLRTHENRTPTTTLPGEENPFEGAQHGAIILNPRDSRFEPRAWAKTLIGMQARDQETPSHRTAGFTFKNLGAHGYGTPTDYQKDVANVWLQAGALVRKLLGTGKQKIQILRDFNGLVESGEMLVILGRPGSGCSTFLKTISGETHGFKADPGPEINYQGISARQMHNQFRGEAIYTAETDVHFPQLTVGETLSFAAKARAPRNRPENVSSDQYAEHMKDIIMTMLGLNHTMNSKVGDDFIRGVSGGERKRVSIAEAALNGSPLHCWDNSTRGLDSANALEFCKTLRLETELSGSTACVAIYQASQAAYEVRTERTFS
jgi:ATP-binding cassette, subfamily G (WHITE), member 2, PDR